jgi:hypothetical protein
VVHANLDRAGVNPCGLASADVVPQLDLTDLSIRTGGETGRFGGFHRPCVWKGDGLVELRGFEPLAFSLRTRRATNCATAPSGPSG